MENNNKKRSGRAKLQAALSLFIHVVLIPVVWLVLQSGSSLPEVGLAMLYYILPVICIATGLILLFFRRRRKAIRHWFVYNFIGTGSLVYATIGLVLFIFLHPEKATIIPSLLSLVTGYSILDDIFTDRGK